MFGMDMAFGADMMGIGAMDMGIGAMDMGIGAMEMQMGNPILGAEMMGIGAMDMGIGAMDMGMGMGMMGGGMMGMGAMDMGLGLGMMEMGMMGGGIGICPPGCMRACCRPVIVCPPGCMGPCCINKRVVVRTVPNNQYNSNNGFVQLPPVARNYQPPPQQQPQQYATTSGNLDIQQQIMNEQARIQREKREQMIYKQRLEQEQLQLQKEKIEFEQKQLEQKRQEQIRLQQIQEKQRLEKLRLQQEELARQAQYKEERMIQESKDNFACEQAPPNPYEEKEEVLFEGVIYQQQFDKWQQVNARLTVRAFLGFNVESINKIKVKYASHVPNTRIMKLTIHGRGDIFIAVQAQDQAQWMCRLIWARLNRTGKTCNPSESYVGSYEGQIIRKSFFNGWELKYASISMSGLRLSNNNGGSVTHIITAVPQIWTRFDFIHGNMLIIKMHVNGRKNEIGIPLEHAMVWLKGLYTLVRPN